MVYTKCHKKMSICPNIIVAHSCARLRGNDVKAAPDDKVAAKGP